jgi:hypothetical protein
MATKRCTEADRRGRLAKARQFLEAAELVEALADEEDLLDALVTLCVHAGIAAADVICCARLGEHATGQNHTEAVELLARVDKALSRDLSKLLGMKTRAGYSSTPVSAANARSAVRSATRLVVAAASS